ncbi:MAG: hypothetical protein RMM58_16085, partial [Chloroflexota bacterium]|nr:hypothetical protein [Chloroflexota bacterium]
SKITAEFQNLQQEITRIAQTTQFGDTYLINGNLAQTAGSSLGANLVAAQGFLGVRTVGAIAATTYSITVDAATSTITLFRGASTSNIQTSVQFAAPAAGSFTVTVGGVQVDLIASAIATGSIYASTGNTTFTVTGGTSLMVGAGNTQVFDALSFGLANMTAGSAGLAVGSLQVD